MKHATSHRYTSRDAAARILDPESVRASLVALARSVCPDLAPFPFYVVLTSDLPPVDHPGGAVHGLASHALCHKLRDAIGASRWRGPGPAVLVNDLAIIRAHRPVRDPVLRASLARQRIRAVTLHEVAHVVDLGQYGQGEPPAAPAIAEGRAAVDGTIFARRLGRLRRSDPAHGPQFVRLCLHLARRVAASGVVVDPAGVCSTPFYGLSPVADYLAAIGDEPDRLAGLSLADVKRVPLPRPFADLFIRDIARQQAMDRRNARARERRAAFRQPTPDRRTPERRAAACSSPFPHRGRKAQQ